MLGANIQLPSRRIAGRALSIEKADVKKVVFSAIALHCETISSVKPVSKVAESRFLEYLFST